MRLLYERREALVESERALFEGRARSLGEEFRAPHEDVKLARRRSSTYTPSPRPRERGAPGVRLLGDERQVLVRREDPAIPKERPNGSPPPRARR